MKSDKVMIAALLVAALMIMPIALFSSNDDSAADPEPQMDPASMLMSMIGSIPDIDPLDIVSNMSGVMNYQNEPKGDPEPIYGNITKESNDVLLLNKDYVYEGDYVINMKAGSAVVMCIGQDFSISTDQQFAGLLQFMKDASLYIVSDMSGISHVSDISDDVIIYQHDFADKDSTRFAIEGGIDYTMKIDISGKVEATFTAKKETTIAFYDDGIAGYYRAYFATDNCISASIPMTSDTQKKTMEIKGGKLSANVDLVFMNKNDETVPLKGQGEYDFDASIPTETGTMTASVKGGLDLTLSYGDDTASFKNDTDVRISVENFKDPQKQPVAVINGTVTFSLKCDKLEASQNDVTVTLSNLDLSVDSVFDDSGFKLSAKGGLDSFTMTPKEGMESYIDDVDFDLEYSAETVSENQPQASSMILFITAIVDPTTYIANMMKEYLDGIEKGTETKTVQEYASAFFMGKIDTFMDITNADVKGKSLSVDLTVGDVCMYTEAPMEISNLKFSADINKDVGFSASLKFDKIFVTDNKTNANYTVEPLDLSLKTYTGDDKKYVFTADFSLSGEIEQYQQQKLVMNPFVDDMSGTLNIGVQVYDLDKVDIITDAVRISADEITMNSYGIDTSAKNVKYDTEKKVFTVDKIEISGYYNGGDPFGKYGLVKEVSGSYDDVVFDIAFKGPMPEFMNMTVSSLNVEYIDIYDSKLTVTRSYSETDKAIVNEYEGEGQFWLFNMVSDDVLYGLVGSDDIRFEGMPENTQVKDNYVFKGKVIVDQSTVGLLPEGFNNILIDADKNIVIDRDGFYQSRKLTGGFSGEIYVTSNHMVESGYGVNHFTIGDSRYNLYSFKGAAMCIALDGNDVKVTKIIALDGFNLESDPEKSGIKGFAIGDIKDNEAPVTSITAGTPIEYYANSIQYKIYIDGELKKSDVDFRGYVKIDDLPAGTLMLTDENGAECGIMQPGPSWIFDQYPYSYDLKLTAVKVKQFDNVQKGADKLNDTSDDGIVFTVSLQTGEIAKFKLGTNVRFDVVYQDLVGSDPVNLVAKETKFNGKNAYLIKACTGGVDIITNLYIPASEGDRLMHVDEYGRATQQSASLTKIGSETFLVVKNINSYSIFYKEADNPRYDTGGSNNNLLFVAIGAAVAVIVIAGAVFFIKKH